MSRAPSWSAPRAGPPGSISPPSSRGRSRGGAAVGRPPGGHLRRRRLHRGLLQGRAAGGRAGRQRAIPAADLRPRPDVRAAVRRRAGDDRLRRPPAGGGTTQPLRRSRSTEERPVVPLPPAVPGDAAGRAAAARTRRGAAAASPGRGVVRGRGPARRGDRRMPSRAGTRSGRRGWSTCARARPSPRGGARTVLRLAASSWTTRRSPRTRRSR